MNSNSLHAPHAETASAVPPYRAPGARPAPRAGLRLAAAAAAMALLALTQGCAAPRLAALGNPTPIHAANPATGDPRYTATAVDADAANAALLVAERYYKAMAAAKVDGAAQAAVDGYVNEGVALIELQCLRWFGRLEDAQRSLQVNDTNRNVITQLGTTVIGLAKLNPIVTSAYGAANSAYTGFNANFDNAFLAAPNAENVKRLTLDAVASRAAALQNPATALYPKSFSSAYLQLEKLAGQCTFAEVKRLTTKSVDQAMVRANPSTGEAVVFSTATAEQATTLKARLGTLFERIDAIKPEAATTLARVMPSRREPAVAELLKATDPRELRHSDDKVARATLKQVLVLTAKTDAAVTAWEDSLRLVTD